MGKMGISELNTNRKQYLRKYRFHFYFMAGSSGGMVHQNNLASVIHMASRPKITFEQRILHGSAEDVPYHGRGTWENIDITFLEVTGDKRIYNWLKKQFDPESGNVGYHSEVVNTVMIKMVNGVGVMAQMWYLYDCWAASIDWQELEYASTDIANIQVSLAYTRAVQVFNESPDGMMASGPPTSKPPTSKPPTNKPPTNPPKPSNKPPLHTLV